VIVALRISDHVEHGVLGNAPGAMHSRLRLQNLHVLLARSTPA
jgi:hypothetical protein